MTLDDALDILSELPPRVQVAVISNLHAMRSRGLTCFHDYPLLIAEYIQASGLMNVQISASGYVRFSASETSRLLTRHMRTVLEIYGVEFITPAV